MLELFSLYSIIKRNKNTQLVIYKIIIRLHCPPDNYFYFFHTYIVLQPLEFIDPFQGAITLFWNCNISPLHFTTWLREKRHISLKSLLKYPRMRSRVNTGWNLVSRTSCLKCIIQWCQTNKLRSILFTFSQINQPSKCVTEMHYSSFFPFSKFNIPLLNEVTFNEIENFLYESTKGVSNSFYLVH